MIYVTAQMIDSWIDQRIGQGKLSDELRACIHALCDKSAAITERDTIVGLLANQIRIYQALDYPEKVTERLYAGIEQILDGPEPEKQTACYSCGDVQYEAEKIINEFLPASAKKKVLS